jgi:hypothetical protein
MRVKMKTTMCGPDGSHAIGSIVDFPAEKARELIKGGFACAVDPPAKAPPETAALATEEAAVHPRTTTRKTRGRRVSG